MVSVSQYNMHKLATHGFKLFRQTLKAQVHYIFTNNKYAITKYHLNNNKLYNNTFSSI